MDNLETMIKLFFKHVSAQSIICEKICFSSISEDDFIQLAEAYIKNYSHSELRHMYYCYKDMLDKELSLNARDGLNIFGLLFYYSPRLLTIENNEIVCRFNELLHWRMLSFEVSEDIIIASYAAVHRIRLSRVLPWIQWKNVISHNNLPLKKFLREGISENHFHLWGSAPIFDLSWISIMNHIDNSSMLNVLKSYDSNRRYSHVRYGEAYTERPLYIQAIQAALIRLYLFSKMEGIRIHFGSYKLSYRNLVGFMRVDKAFARFNHLVILAEPVRTAIHNEPDRSDYITVGRVISLAVEGSSHRDLIPLCDTILQLFYGMRLLKTDIDNFMPDQMSVPEFIDFLWRCCGKIYLAALECFLDGDYFCQLWNQMTEQNIKEALMEPDDILIGYKSRIASLTASLACGDYPDYMLSLRRDRGSCDEDEIFEGEHIFLYRCLSELYDQKNRYDYHKNLFYAYLILRENIRSELVQSNMENIGFENFQIYERRKAELINDHLFQTQAAKLAVSDHFFSGNIRSFEIRITPGLTAREDFEYIKKLDELIGDAPPGSCYYYVYHFIKRKDDMENDSLIETCRHSRLRKRYIQNAGAIMEFRENYNVYARRLAGIDAASEEKECRPEVFGEVFRCLKNHIAVYESFHKTEIVPQLHATYHVGEDFYDIADGLRAIDEAIHFLNLDCGDRLGHALALGVNVEEWYVSKNYRILISKQDYLDNLAWLHHCILRFQIRDSETLRNDLIRQFNALFQEVYGQYIQRSEVEYILQKKNPLGSILPGSPEQAGYSFDIYTYYMSWRLRGDDPDAYRYGYLNESDEEDRMRPFRLNRRYKTAEESRCSFEAVYLYYCYHYNRAIKEEGAKIKEVTIDRFYIEGVQRVQKAMQHDIARLGLSIETNPSSNYLIGNFKRFDKHPILQFYNRGLTVDPGELLHNPQLSVSINTDDMGVFSTSLENEYAIMAISLLKVKNPDGTFRYSPAQVYNWLNEIRMMGNDQAFFKP